MAEIQNAVYQPPKKVYHMDLQQVLGDVGLGNNKKELKNDAPKRYPWLLTDNGEKMEIKAGPDINKYFDEINQNLNVSYSQKFIIQHLFLIAFFIHFRVSKSISIR